MSFQSYFRPSNPYQVKHTANAVFHFEQSGGFVFDPSTGNYTKSPNLIIETTTANVIQASDPNLELQPGLDYNRTYFTGYLISPQEDKRAIQTIGVQAIINGFKGVFDFIPVFTSSESTIVEASTIVGQRIAGYFRLS